MTWVEVPSGSDFPIENLPYGAFSTDNGHPRIGVAIGDRVLDLAPVLDDATFAEPTLNRFVAQGRPRWQEVRAQITELLSEDRHRPVVEPHLVPQESVTLHLPFEAGDYVDYYASEDHASNLGRMFRPDQAALTPNWKWMPIGYHGRAGTIVVSGTPVVRPAGQRKAPADSTPSFGPSLRLDIEAELGFVVGPGTRLGEPVPLDRAPEHLFGVVLVNDWSARDIQSWEYVPLGPYLGKSFATSVSPWVVPFEALEEARTPSPARDPQPLSYLRGEADRGLDVALDVALNGETVSHPPYGRMYWSPEQMLTHMTVNGASLRAGDFFASGTISGPDPDQRGSFIEMSWNGTQPLRLADGSTRGFLEDGDTVSITARARGRGGIHIGFGEVTGTIQPAVLGEDSDDTIARGPARATAAAAARG
jgi:fumarylacetoacetase